MATLTTDKNGTIVVSALGARANFGELLRRVEDERRSLVIEKRGTPEPEVLRVIGKESERKGTNILSARQIEQVIKASRTQRSKR